MSTEAPAVPAAVEAAAAAVPAVVETPEPVAAEPPWAKARVERGARDVIKKAGVKLAKGDPIEKGVDAINERVESQKERRRAAEKRADEAEKAVDEMRTNIAALTAMQSLDEGQRAIIKKLANNNPVEQVKQIGLMKSMAAMAPPPAAAAPAAIAAPATTTPAGGTPSPANASGEDVKSQYARLKANAQKNPIAAAQFALDHENELLGE